MKNFIQIEGNQIELTQEQLEQLKEIYLPKPTEITKWEDLGEVSGYYVENDSSISKASNHHINKGNRNIFPTKEEAEACLALSQLSQLRDRYNEGWKPDWTDSSEFKYTIYFCSNKIIADTLTCISMILSFKSKDIREKFLKNHIDLIEIAKPLL